MKIHDGWIDTAHKIASPNFNSRPNKEVSLLVIHNISLPKGQFGGEDIVRLFTNQLTQTAYPEIYDLKVSSHFLIRRQGELVQFVSTNNRAWHAGASYFEGRKACNDFSIGIELEGTDTMPYTEEQYSVLIALTRLLQGVYPLITKERITGHEHIAPGRKTDPGPAFNWDRYLSALALI